MTCVHCSNPDVIKYGTRGGLQVYKCKSCNRKFTDNGAEPGRRLPAEHVGASLTMFYDGLSTDDIRRTIDLVHDYAPSTATVYEWIRDYSELANQHFKSAKPQRIGDTWVADETMIKVQGEPHWVWTVMDARTRYILATHVSKGRSIRDAKTVMRKAMDSADGHAPKTLMAGNLKSTTINLFGAVLI